MRCPKCNSRIDNTIEYCNYCGERVKPNDHNAQYNYSKSYSNIKKEYDTPHEGQYTYSKSYSDVKKEYDENHEIQYNYSKTYSDSKKEYDTPHDDQYTYSQLYSNSTSSSVTSDTDYIKAYFGERVYNYITNPKIPFSSETFFLGPLYLLYRKLWLPAIISTILIIVISISTKNFITSYLIINAIFSKIIHRILLDKASKKVEKIKMKNPDKDSRELLELCRKSGQPTKIGYIIFIAIVIILFLVSLFILYQ